MNLNELSDILKGVGDESRLRILCMLFENEELCVSEVAKKMRQSVAITSHHLRALESLGLLAKERRGKQQCYRIAKSPLMTDMKKFICKYKNNDK